MKITKTIASEVAKKLTAKKQDKIKQYQQLLSNEIQQICISKLFDFKNLNLLSNDFRGYVSFTNSVKLFGAGFNGEQIYIVEPLPIKRQNYSLNLNFVDLDIITQGENLKKQFDKIENQKKELNKLLIDLENSLYRLKTLQNCKLHLPVSLPFLLQYENKNTEIMVNYQDLINRLEN